MQSQSTEGIEPVESTAELKSSIKISGEATMQRIKCQAYKPSEPFHSRKIPKAFLWTVLDKKRIYKFG